MSKIINVFDNEVKLLFPETVSSVSTVFNILNQSLGELNNDKLWETTKIFVIMNFVPCNKESHTRRRT